MPTQYQRKEASLRCLVCRRALRISAARGRKSGKAFLLLVCPTDGRHFRAFINDPAYVAKVLDRLEAKP